jgi:hypothetical protein
VDSEDRLIRTLLAEPPATTHAVAVARRRLTDEITAPAGTALRESSGAAMRDSGIAAMRAAGGAALREPGGAALREPGGAAMRFGGAGRRRAPRRTLWPAGRWRWSLAGGGLTAAVAAGLALAMSLAPTGPGGTAGGGRGTDGGGPGGTATPAGPAADASPEQLLLAAAGTAGRMTGTGKYWRFLTVSETGPLQVRSGPEPYRIMQREASETWTARDPSGQNWAGHQMLGTRPRSDADRAAWQRAGSPTTFDLGPADSPNGGRSTRQIDPQPGTLTAQERYPSYDSDLGPLALADLPTDPRALRAEIVARIERQSRGESVDVEWMVFQTLSGLLARAPASAELRAAAFTVLSELPGVVNAGATSDAAGRAGVSLDLRRTNGGYLNRSRLILDPTTYQLLGINAISGPLGADGEVDTSSGKVFKEGAFVVLRAEWTDQEPTAPDVR